MPKKSPDPPLELPDQCHGTGDVSPAFKAHLARFTAPTTASSLQRSPRRDTPPTRATPDPNDTKPEPRPTRLRSAATPPRSRESISPYFRASKRPPSEPVADEPDDSSGSNEEPQQKKKKKRPSRPYSDASTYAEFGADPLLDYLEPDLNLVLCGINPGLKSAQMGQHYASPTNHFWKALAGSGLTDRLLHPSEGAILPGEYNIGSTNLVPRPTAEMSELSLDEMRKSVPALLRKIIKYKPKIFAFVGMKICEIVFRYLHSLPSSSSPTKAKKRAMSKIELGLRPAAISLTPERVGDDDADEKECRGERRKVLFWCLPSSSARVVAYQASFSHYRLGGLCSPKVQLVDKIRIFGEVRKGIEMLNAGTLELPENMVEYRQEDLFPPAETVHVKEEEDTKPWNVTLIEAPRQHDGTLSVKVEAEVEEGKQSPLVI
ncbi:hypothetical protein JCM3766R1_004646 [Sporobolomyces carnicolor]